MSRLVRSAEQEAAGRAIYWDSFGFSCQNGGVGRYSRDLQRSLNAEGVYPKKLIADGFLRGGVLNKIPGGKILWPGWAFHKAVSEAKGQKNILFHGLSNINLPLVKKKNGCFFVITVHDVIPLLEGAGVSRSYREQFRWAMPRVLDVADSVLCVSHWTRKTLMERFPEAEEKSQVISNGKGELAITEQIPVRTFGKEEVRLLYVARMESYKRLSLIAPLLRSLPCHYVWTQITDTKGMLYLKKVAGDLLRAGRLRVYTGMSDQELAGIYSTTDLYVHPSLYEGFGLPAWEALGFGVRVLFQKGSALDDLEGLDGIVGLERGASPRDWVDSVKSLCEAGAPRSFASQAENFIRSRPGWHEAAISLKKVYNGLMK